MQKHRYENDEGAELFLKSWYGQLNGEYVKYLVKYKKPSGNMVTVGGEKDFDDAKQLLEEKRGELL